MWKLIGDASVWVIGSVLCGFWLYSLIGLHRFGFEESGMIDNIQTNERNDRYRRAMEWATALDPSGVENIPKGERIFNTNWDKFPKLFFYDTKHTYVYGLDPNYLYSADPDKYKLVKDITEAKIDDAGPLIREKLGANYIFTDAKDNTEMIAKILESGWGEMIYEDDEARIVKIRATKGEPFDAAKDQEPETPEEKKILDDEEKNGPKNLNSNLDDNEDEN
jgi:hypothetical protein